MSIFQKCVCPVSIFHTAWCRFFIKLCVGVEFSISGQSNRFMWGCTGTYTNSYVDLWSFVMAMLINLIWVARVIPRFWMFAYFNSCSLNRPEEKECFQLADLGWISDGGTGPRGWGAMLHNWGSPGSLGIEDCFWCFLAILGRVWQRSRHLFFNVLQWIEIISKGALVKRRFYWCDSHSDEQSYAVKKRWKAGNSQPPQRPYHPLNLAMTLISPRVYFGGLSTCSSIYCLDRTV